MRCAPGCCVRASAASAIAHVSAAAQKKHAPSRGHSPVHTGPGRKRSTSSEECAPAVEGRSGRDRECERERDEKEECSSAIPGGESRADEDDDEAAEYEAPGAAPMPEGLHSRCVGVAAASGDDSHHKTEGRSGVTGTTGASEGVVDGEAADTRCGDGGGPNAAAAAVAVKGGESCCCCEAEDQSSVLRRMLRSDSPIGCCVASLACWLPAPAGPERGRARSCSLTRGQNGSATASEAANSACSAAGSSCSMTHRTSS